MLYLLPKLLFPLMAMTFMETQCAQIQSPALCALLPKLHLNRNMACSIIHGPALYGGRNIPHLYTSQGMQQLKILIGHLWAHDKTWKLLQISHGYLQLLIGISSDFLHSPYTVFHHWACPSWFTSVWLFMSQLNITLTIKDLWLLPSPTGADINLVDYFISQGLTAKQLVSINCCRVYLQLLLLSDMVSADGRWLIPQALCSQLLVVKRSMLKWPDQQMPSKADWKSGQVPFWLWPQAINSYHPLTWPRLHRIRATSGIWTQVEVFFTLITPVGTHTRLSHLLPIAPGLVHAHSADNWRKFATPLLLLSTLLLFGTSPQRLWK